ncbi:hypothetical protein LOC68_12010 [Blastopirellula sp. JC732]|uniref:Uncharacterized protein n=1 Tax=Blastopirellula sediminis TaxID=2894196 RepID=A0A9X1ML12_9BACT|nr:hypothetical protein [Blastopirellula sediminis]MCC9607584.1 hypothetical protein [Blastopirellula sediminis]MCC9629123.1 hypothetical protein [Blastopirellula sediminis]
MEIWINVMAVVVGMLPIFTTLATWILCSLIVQDAQGQTLVAASAAEQLSWEYLQFELASRPAVFRVHPLVIPGDVVSIWRVMRGVLSQRPWEVQHFRVKMSESDLCCSSGERARIAAKRPAERKKSICPLTVMMCQEDVGLPDFYLTPFGGMHYFIEEAVPGAQIATPHGDWSYVLLAPDPQLLGELFSGPVKEFFRSQELWNVQCIRGRLTAWRLNRSEFVNNIAMEFPNAQPNSTQDMVGTVRAADSILSLLLTRWRELQQNHCDERS